jgi:hypothetical protein
MSTTEIRDSERTDSTVPTQFYTPAMARPSVEPGRLERFIENLYSGHRL